MRSINSGPALALDSPAWGTPLREDELRSIQGGAFPIIGWIAGTFVLSVLIGMIDAALFGDCNCKR